MRSKTYSLGLIGYPLSYSLSPRLHTAALEAMRLDGDCRLYPIPPLPEGEELLSELLGRLRKDEMAGLNVTIPHKQAIIPYLDELSPTVTAIGAVNTVFVRKGLLVGENTDAPGFLSDLERFLRKVSFRCKTPLHYDENRLEEKRAVLLGAGGAARAVAYALVRGGWEVTIAARRLEQSLELANTLQMVTSSFHSKIQTIQPLTTVCNTHIIPLDKLSFNNLKPKIIVNATPVGMWPEVNDSPWPQGVPFPSGVLVYDLVYHPAETALMRAARSAGLPATNGLGMLIEQAALALEIWTGRPAPRKAMWEAATGFSGSPGD